VARTKSGIEDAFVQLVLEHGYEAVSVEDIAERADVARTTVYAHYPNKEAVLSAVFARVTEDLMGRLAYQSGPWDQVPRQAVHAAYQHVADMPDLYRACLSDTRARRTYLSILTRYAEQNFRDRVKARKRRPRVPIEVMARGLAGANVAILEAWLDGDIDLDADSLAAVALDMLVAGLAWAQGLTLAEVGYDGPPSPRPRRSLTAHEANPDPKGANPKNTRARSRTKDEGKAVNESGRRAGPHLWPRSRPRR
jgi:AcrR family transcriptional regulator